MGGCGWLWDCSWDCSWAAAGVLRVVEVEGWGFEWDRPRAAGGLSMVVEGAPEERE